MLSDGGQTRHLIDRSTTVGFLPRGGDLNPGAVVAQIPTALDDSAEPSVCGLKAFLIDERRAFRDDDCRIHEIDCARIAALDITDSPVHIHGETVETYHILTGSGRMLLGDTVTPVCAGTIIVIPPGQRHGLTADDRAQPVRVVMTFTPGLAPVAHQRFRDERILAERASVFIASLG
jgi:mannose-6-phosphate isomerase-like protein (cupin superfamily)